MLVKTLRNMILVSGCLFNLGSPPEVEPVAQFGESLEIVFNPSLFCFIQFFHGFCYLYGFYKKHAIDAPRPTHTHTVCLSVCLSVCGFFLKSNIQRNQDTFDYLI